MGQGPGGCAQPGANSSSLVPRFMSVYVCLCVSMCASEWILYGHECARLWVHVRCVCVHVPVCGCVHECMRLWVCVSAHACECMLYPFLSFRKAEASSGQSPLSSLCSLVVKRYEGQFSNLVLPVLTSHQCVLGKNGQKQFYSIVFTIGSISLNVQHLFYCNLSKFSTLFLLLYVYIYF